MNHVQLTRWIDRLEGLTTVAKDAAPRVANAVRDELEANIAAGRDPYGAAWDRREDGGVALRTAGKALRVVAVGSTVFCRLGGHIARHNNGRARGGVVRAIFPAHGLPASLGAAIKRAVGAVLREGE